MFSQYPKKTQWIYPNIDPQWATDIRREFGLPQLTAEILAARGFHDFASIHEYLYGNLPQLPSPTKIFEMDKAVARMIKALRQQEKILICGDNDVDGMSGTALLVELLRNLQASVFFCIPESTPLKTNNISQAHQEARRLNCTLLITVDCGTTAIEEITKAQADGIDVIVTDHHELLGADLAPPAYALLNPKHPQSRYPNRELAGVGVAFKLAHALCQTLNAEGYLSTGIIDLKDCLDLVALGTIADMATLLGENRILVRYGMKKLQQTRRLGLIKLSALCNVETTRMTPQDISTKLAPKLNSLARMMADPRKGVELLLAQESDTAELLVRELNAYNLERQKIEKRDVEAVEAYLTTQPNILEDKALVLASREWHPGLVPILASRLAKRFARPVVVIAINKNGIGKGSLRTIPEFELLPVLSDNKSLLEGFGGHNLAAGISIKEENIPAFKKAFIENAKDRLSETALCLKLRLDASVCFDDLSFETLESLRLLEPFGNENPPPTLYCQVKQTRGPRPVSHSHLKLSLEQSYKDRTGQMVTKRIDGLGLFMADQVSLLANTNGPFSIAFSPNIGDHNQHKSSCQILIKDFHIEKH